MAVITGSLGAVSGIDTVRNWQIRTAGDHKRYVASNTKGGPGRKKGNVDWSGRFERYDGEPLKMPKDTFDFIGSIDGTKGVKGPCIVDSLEIAINQEAGEIISQTVEFSGNGELSKADATAVSDLVVPDPASSIGCIVEVAAPAAEPSYAALADVRTVTLRFTADNKAYNTSTTGRYTKRAAGNWDLEASFVVYTDDLSLVPDEEDEKFVRVYIDAVKFWLFEALLFGEQADWGPDRENAELVGGTLNAAFTGYYDLSGTSTEGKLVKPDTTTWWPAA